MLSYELCKQLKDGGFPILSEPRYDFDCSCGLKININHDRKMDGSESVVVPTLSELIEECGDKFYSLVYATDNDWRCFSEREGDYIDTADGRTPEEAVANLWLKLNEKK